jgi:hypothetical protein
MFSRWLFWKNRSSERRVCNEVLNLTRLGEWLTADRVATRLPYYGTEVRVELRGKRARNIANKSFRMFYRRVGWVMPRQNFVSGLK